MDSAATVLVKSPPVNEITRHSIPSAPAITRWEKVQEQIMGGVKICHTCGIHMYFAMFLISGFSFLHYSHGYVAELCANLYLKCAHMQIAGSSKIFIIYKLKTIQSLKILFQNGNGSLEFRNCLQYRSSILSCFLFTFVVMSTQQNEIAI